MGEHLHISSGHFIARLTTQNIIYASSSEKFFVIIRQSSASLSLKPSCAAFRIFTGAGKWPIRAVRGFAKNKGALGVSGKISSVV